MYLLWIILGIGGLWIGTELVIKGALNIADYYNLSHMFVGITILSIGTDLPEIVISIDASIQKLINGIQTSELIVGNAIGSSLSQITLVLGVAGLTGYLALKRKRMFADSFMILASIILVFALGFDGKISQKEGLVLVLVYLIYYVRMFQNEKVLKKVADKKVNRKLPLNIIMLLFGLFLVVYASDIVVHNAVIFAEKMYVKQSLIGIFLIGLGTSLPELAVSVNAARKKANHLSIGNLIGSNIFDTLMPIGVGGAIAELEFSRDIVFVDLPVLLGVTLLALFFFYKSDGLQKWEAIVMISVFTLYAIVKFIWL